MPPLLMMTGLGLSLGAAGRSPAQLAERVLRVTRANWQVADRRVPARVQGASAGRRPAPLAALPRG